MKQLTTERLATILSEELDRDGWGHVDPYLFSMVANGVYQEGDADAKEAAALGKVLDRVVYRLKEES